VPTLALYALLLAGLLGGAHYVLRQAKAEGAAECKAEHQAASDLAYRENAAALAGIATEAQRMAQRAATARAGLDRAAPGLRDAAIASCIGLSAAATPGSPTASAPGVVQADVLGEVGARLRGLAEEATASRREGDACTAAYDEVERRSREAKAPS